jgi:hypothetical protein
MKSGAETLEMFHADIKSYYASGQEEGSRLPIEAYIAHCHELANSLGTMMNRLAVRPRACATVIARPMLN